MNPLPKDCPECDGDGGWNDMDGRWITCPECEGTGMIDDDDSDE
jgi:DnaJ-class molecular chaperone